MPFPAQHYVYDIGPHCVLADDSFYCSAVVCCVNILHFLYPFNSERAGVSGAAVDGPTQTFRRTRALAVSAGWNRRVVGLGLLKTALFIVKYSAYRHVRRACFIRFNTWF